MHIKKIIPLTLLCFQILCSQEQLTQLDVPYETTHTSNKKSIAIPNDKTDEILLFIEDFEKSHIYLLDSEYKEKKHLNGKGLPISFKENIGYQILDNDTYRIFLPILPKESLA